MSVLDQTLSLVVSPHTVTSVVIYAHLSVFMQAYMYYFIIYLLIRLNGLCT